MKSPSGPSSSSKLLRASPLLLLAFLGLSVCVSIGCGVVDDEDEGISEDDLSCRYGYGYGCYGNGYRR